MPNSICRFKDRESKSPPAKMLEKRAHTGCSLTDVVSESGQTSTIQMECLLGEFGASNVFMRAGHIELESSLRSLAADLSMTAISRALNSWLSDLTPSSSLWISGEIICIFKASETLSKAFKIDIWRFRRPQRAICDRKKDKIRLLCLNLGVRKELVQDIKRLTSNLSFPTILPATGYLRRGMAKLKHR